MMASLEYSQTKEWTRLLNSQCFKASRLAKVGRFDDIDFVVDDARPKMVETLQNHYRRVATVFSNKAFGIFANKKFIQPSEIKTPKEDFWKEIGAWSKTQAASKITKINKTTKNVIAGVIHKGMQEGISHVDIAKNIRSTGKITSSYRAKTIALTETHTAAMKSIDSAVKSTRIEMEREWVSARDMRTRRPDKNNIWNHYGKFPNGADGERVPQDKDFVGTGQPLSYPGDPKGSAGNIIRCLTNYGTPIYTSEGWKQVRYIKPGDLVLTHKNRFKKVLRLNKTLYGGEVVRITLDGQGKFIVVTPEHPFLVSRGGRFFRWKEAKYIKLDDSVRFMASYCQWCGKPIPYYNNFCDKYCSGKNLGEERTNNSEFSEERRQVALKQWADPEHRKNMSKKTSAQLKREYANGIRNGNEITKKARKAHYAKWGVGGSFGVLGKTEEFQKARKKAIEKKYGSILNMLKQTAFPALGKTNFGGSKIEQAMADFLDKNNREFVAQFQIGRRRIDFYVEKEKLFIEVDGFPWHEDKERDRKRDLEILSEYPDHKIAHVDYKPTPPKWEFFDLVSLNHTGTFAQVGMKVRSVSSRVLKRRINIYNFAVEDDESYIANGFVTHNCRCVLLYHTVKQMEKIKPYEPESPPEAATPLLEGDLHSSTPLNGGVNVSSVVGVEHEGKRFKAIFKPVDGEDWSQRYTVSNKNFPLAEREALAYEIDDNLGFGMTPPTVMRDFGKGKGSAQKWIDDALEESKWNGRQLTYEERYKIGIFDYVIGNTDRHIENYLRMKKRGVPVLIDHGYSFPDPRKYPVLVISKRMKKTGLSEARFISVAFDDVNVSDDLRKKTLAGLKRLKVNKLVEKYNLTKSEISALKERIKIMKKAVETDQVSFLLRDYGNVGVEDLVERAGK